jgi:hypothetical protein
MAKLSSKEILEKLHPMAEDALRLIDQVHNKLDDNLQDKVLRVARPGA